MSTRAYQDLRVWRGSVRLVVLAYEATREFPRGEQFGLTSQIRRSAASVPASIAEGNGRLSLRDYRRFLSIANGSLREFETHVIVAREIGLLDAATTERCLELAATVGRKLRALSAALERKIDSELLEARRAAPPPGGGAATFRRAAPPPGGGAATSPLAAPPRP